jgi:hypothetical protein
MNPFIKKQMMPNQGGDIAKSNKQNQEMPIKTATVFHLPLRRKAAINRIP